MGPKGNDVSAAKAPDLLWFKNVARGSRTLFLILRLNITLSVFGYHLGLSLISWYSPLFISYSAEFYFLFLSYYGYYGKVSFFLYSLF